MDQVIRNLSIETGLDEKKIKDIYLTYWRAVKSIIRNDKLDEFISKEDFFKNRHCINLIGLGKLGVPYEFYKKIYNHKNNIKDDKH